MYEGRGYDVLGAHTGGYNDIGYGTCFIGDFENVVPAPDAINTYHAYEDVRYCIYQLF